MEAFVLSCKVFEHSIDVFINYVAMENIIESSIRNQTNSRHFIVIDALYLVMETFYRKYEIVERKLLSLFVLLSNEILLLL